jgi:hypothetical protein
MGQIFPYVLRRGASDRRWCLAGIQITLLDRLVALAIESIFAIAPFQAPVYSFSSAVVPLRGMTHCWRIPQLGCGQKPDGSNQLGKTRNRS